MIEPQILYLDVETYCETPLKNGTDIYAENVEIMIAQWALDDPAFEIEGDIHVEDLTENPIISAELIEHLNNPAIKVVIHSSRFDRTVIRHAWGIAIDPARIECTMIRAMSHGLPGGLERLGQIFKLGDNAKQSDGKALIMLFCKPRPRGHALRRATRWTHPDEWERMLSYAGSDIKAMRALRHKLPKWNYPGVSKPGQNELPDEYRYWLIDQGINDRGYKVDIDLAHDAVDMLVHTKKAHDARTMELTNDELSSVQQVGLLKTLLGEYGVDLPDMQKTTLERRIDDPNLPWYVRELLLIRLEGSMASTSKYKALLRSVSSDGRLRGTVQFDGAIRTGRKAGRLFQPQNLVRTPKAFSAAVQEETIAAIKSGAGDIMLDNPNRGASYSLRGAIISDEGRKLVVADLSGIEARVLPWLAGETWKLQAFRDLDAGTGPDIYRTTAGRILNKPGEDVNDDQRQSHGKVPELSCGYGGSVKALFVTARLYNFLIDEVEAKAIVDSWRAEHEATTQFWWDLDDGAREALMSPGRTVQVGEHIRFHRWREWLRMQLPSGRVICYCQPAMAPHPKFGGMAISYLGVNSYSRKWERLFTYGGKFAAEATQGTARDIMLANEPAIEEAGYPIVLEVHDEVVTEPLDDPRFTTAELCALLARRPWFIDERLPLKANGFEGYRYRKGD